MWARRKARRALAQAAYQWQVNETAVLQRVVSWKSTGQGRCRVFRRCLDVDGKSRRRMDDQLAPLLDRAGEHLDVVERGILRLAATELNHRVDVPYSVVINEYVELTKTFGAQDAIST